MIVEASATIGVEAHVAIHDGDKIYDPADGIWPQQLLVSLDGPVEESDPDEIRTVSLLADTPATVFRCEWQRADGNIGRQEGRPLAMVAFLSLPTWTFPGWTKTIDFFNRNRRVSYIRRDYVVLKQAPRFSGRLFFTCASMALIPFRRTAHFANYANRRSQQTLPCRSYWCFPGICTTRHRNCAKAILPKASLATGGCSPSFLFTLSGTHILVRHMHFSICGGYPAMGSSIRSFLPMV
ncbi:FIG00453423: hypothetical protein [Candidatus Paraburkholderia kirkii UZHbot1]|uniref:Uncharacterized protein n=1 Tax=Candidatus Paraburkholderia kirkii UZHbot1 TaxID=1055526 RepID=G4M4X9_9BURK|nr:FIG00453423: hypothetical protein [Candidatus Paraburkholderia kirkii UZHbot1]